MARDGIRLDVLLTERELFPSRTAAARAVRAGQVKLGHDGPVALRPGQEVPSGQEIELADVPRFVSRGGIKLETALDRLEIDVAGKNCLDIGASTGGFTDCLLQRGAAHVVALDVAYGQLADPIRHHDSVTVIERFNARNLTADDLPWPPQLTVIDVAFISLKKILPAVHTVIAPGSEVLAMVKPQFELGRKRVGSGGVVRDAGDRLEAVVGVADFARDVGFSLLGAAPSGLPGPKGNRETFLRLGQEPGGVADGASLCEGIEV